MGGMMFQPIEVTVTKKKEREGQLKGGCFDRQKRRKKTEKGGKSDAVAGLCSNFCSVKELRTKKRFSGPT
jgi:hypothetical protein